MKKTFTITTPNAKCDPTGEYKNYLLGIVFYKYLSDSFLIRVYDLINDEKPKSLKVALEAYKNELKGEYANDLLDEQ